MQNKICSKFEEMPKLKLTWLFLSLSSVLIFGIVFLFIQAFTPIKAISGTNPYSAVYSLASKLIVIAIIEIIIFIPSLVLGICAYKKGERSWFLWIGFLPVIMISILIGLNVIAFIFQLGNFRF